MASAKEIIEKYCKKFFLLFDLNNDGRVIKEQVMGYLWRLTMEAVPYDNFMGIFNRMNTDERGKSNYDDFVEIFSNPNRGQEQWASCVFENLKYFVSLLSDEDIDNLVLENNIERVTNELVSLVNESEKQDFVQISSK